MRHVQLRVMSLNSNTLGIRRNHGGYEMGFLKSLYGAVARDAKIAKLKKDFYRVYPGEAMQATFEGYCGLGIAVALSINEGKEDDRLWYIGLVDQGLSLEKEHHRPFANQAYVIGVETTLNKQP